jgi:alpha-mannosidase
VLPHAGSRQAAEVAAEALRFNAPLLVRRGSAEERSFLSVEGGLLVDTVKRAEDGDGLRVRLYEPHGGRGTARLRVGVPFAGAALANLLEEPAGEAEVDGGDVLLPFAPFQIVTVVLDRAPA